MSTLFKDQIYKQLDNAGRLMEYTEKIINGY